MPCRAADHDSPGPTPCAGRGGYAGTTGRVDFGRASVGCAFGVDAGVCSGVTSGVGSGCGTPVGAGCAPIDDAKGRIRQTKPAVRNGLRRENRRTLVTVENCIMVTSGVNARADIVM